MAKLPLATDIPWAEKLMLAANSYLTTVVDESLAVAAGPSTMVADKLSTAEPMHNIDSRLSELMFDADKPSSMVADKSSAVEPMHNIDNRLSEPMFDANKQAAVKCDNQTD